MITGQVKINNKDAFTTFGIVLPNSSISALMCPPSLKSYISNTGASEDGTQVLSTGDYVPKVDERELSLVIYITASSTSDFLTRLSLFRAEMLKGAVNLWISADSTHLYRCIYESCSQFTQYNGKLAKFTLKLKEPNPNNNALT